MLHETANLPTDVFDKLLSRLSGLPNGAHTQPSVVQDVDFYGNTTSFMVQTVRTESGPTVFVTQVNAAGSIRFILPANVLRVIDRQKEATTTTIRRRHGKRLAEERGGGSPFTDEMREKARAARVRNALKRKNRGKA